MERRYSTVDVFTSNAFDGNPLAVVLDAEGLSSLQMQAIAREFNYSETTFVLAARDVHHTAWVRIFTPHTEVRFAGHPNIGTAVVLARELEGKSISPVDQVVFEEAAGIVSIRLLRNSGTVVGAELTAPEALTIGTTVAVNDVAACLSVASGDILVSTHAPRIISVGLPFLVAELAGRDALSRAKPNWLAHERVLPAIGTDAVFAYIRGSVGEELQARMFAPLDGIVEDPATGSAAAATIAFLAQLRPEREGEILWRIEQGVDMGRPSRLWGRTEKQDGATKSVHLGGNAVPVMRGLISLG